MKVGVLELLLQLFIVHFSGFSYLVHFVTLDRVLRDVAPNLDVVHQAAVVLDVVFCKAFLIAVSEVVLYYYHFPLCFDAAKK